MLFSSSGKYRNFVRLSAGQPWSPRVEEAVRTVGRLAADAQ
jgi:DNA-binding transcriptional MocR family regulator